MKTERKRALKRRPVRDSLWPAPMTILRQTMLSLSVMAAPAIAAASDQTFAPEQIAFFEDRIRPLLVEQCFKCHSAEAKVLKGGLRLDSRDGLLQGGDSGPAVSVGNPDESPLIRAVRYESLEMPPDGKLTVRRIADLEEWIRLGLPWPEDSTGRPTPLGEDIDWDSVRESHWAWRSVKHPMPPPGHSSLVAREPLDRFITGKLEAAGLSRAPPADARTLYRRITLDLTGLPPRPDETDRFVSDRTPDGFERALDRLLASPHYGERWGRHWLDVARYSDGYGGFLDVAVLSGAWHYRDWVVRAFNSDLPFDEFVRQQIAGDLLDDRQSAIGSGFFAIGPTYRSDGKDPDSIAQARSETLDDRVDTFSRGFLGLTVSCARCHDHKFDPIATLDYYSIAGIFNNSQVVEYPLVPQSTVDAYRDAQASIRARNEQFKARRTELSGNGRRPSEEEKVELQSLKDKVEQLRKSAPPRYPFAHTLTDSGHDDMRVALRGNLLKPGPVAPRRFLRVVAGVDPPRFSDGSGRRELAHAVTARDNPLTSRVIANRIWLWHFGRAIVRSPDNFGTIGREPTHPELLDCLASELIKSGWSIKRLHRRIMMSATYRTGSERNEQAFAADGDNALVWRMNPRRLEVESWRDALLMVTGELDRTLGGPSIQHLMESRRRTIYSAISRNGDQFASDEFLRIFDFPVPRATIARRTTSTVPQQFLFMMNSEFMVQRARALAARLGHHSDHDQWIDRAYAILFSRRPKPAERQLGLQFLKRSVAASPAGTGLSRHEQYAQVLLSSHEFLHVR